MPVQQAAGSAEVFNRRIWLPTAANFAHFGPLQVGTHDEHKESKMWDEFQRIPENAHLRNS